MSVEKVWLLGLKIMTVHLRDLTGETQREFFENCIKKIKGKNIETKRRYESRMWSVFIGTVD